MEESRELQGTANHEKDRRQYTQLRQCDRPTDHTLTDATDRGQHGEIGILLRVMLYNVTPRTMAQKQVESPSKTVKRTEVACWAMPASLAGMSSAHRDLTWLSIGCEHDSSVAGLGRDQPLFRIVLNNLATLQYPGPSFVYNLR